jgi:transketolase
VSQLVTEGASLRQAFGSALVSEAERGIQFLVADMDVAGGVCTDKFRDLFPSRFVQMGIAEQAACGISAGLALATGEPVVWATFGVFGARAFEIARLSVVYNNANVKICLSHLGTNAGPDGHSAQSLEHYAIWRTLGIPVIHPCDSYEMAAVVKWALAYDGPCVIFTGRSPTEAVFSPADFSNAFTFKPGVSRWWGIEDEQEIVTLFGCGHTTRTCLDAKGRLSGEGIYCRVVNLSSLSPVDVTWIIQCAKATRAFVTVEDHSVGGLFSIVAETVTQYCHPLPIQPVLVKGFGQSGEPAELAEHYGIGVDGIIAAVKQVLKRKL